MMNKLLPPQATLLLLLLYKIYGVNGRQSFSYKKAMALDVAGLS